MDDKQRLARRLAKAREKSGMKQEFVARALNIQRTALAGIEAGTRDVSALELRDLCLLYHIEPNEMLAWKERYQEVKASALTPEELKELEELEAREALKQGERE